MSEKTTSAMISRRRALSLLGLATALSLAVPPTVLTMSVAEAQPVAPPAGEPTAAPGGAQTGTERRQGRRTRRVKRRVERRTARKQGRRERRELRRTGGEDKT
jgi:hypothetical protein